MCWAIGALPGVYTFYSGIPFTAIWGSESSLLDPYGYATAVPNKVGNVHYIHKPSCWFYSSGTAGAASTARAFRMLSLMPATAWLGTEPAIRSIRLPRMFSMLP